MTSDPTPRRLQGRLRPAAPLPWPPDPATPAVIPQAGPAGTATTQANTPAWVRPGAGPGAPEAPTVAALATMARHTKDVATAHARFLDAQQRALGSIEALAQAWIRAGIVIARSD